jgi:hypothetical protein
MPVFSRDVILCVFAVACLELVAFSGGMFYAFGGIATDVKIAGNFTQKQVNLIGGLCYTSGCSFQLLIGYLVTFALVPVILISQFIAIVGWGMQALIVVYAPQSFILVMIGYLVISLGVCSAAGPMSVLFNQELQKMNGKQIFSSDDATQKLEKVGKISTQVFIALYAASGGIASTIYIFSDGESEGKLFWFYLMSCILSLITFVVTLVWLIFKNSSEEKTQSIEESNVIVNEKNPLKKSISTSAPHFQTEELNQASQPQTLLSRLKDLFSSLNLWIGLIGLFLVFGPAVNFYNNSGSMVLAIGGGEKDMGFIFLEFCLGQIVGRTISSMLITKGTSHWPSTISFVLFPFTLFVISCVLWQVSTIWLLHCFSILNALIYGSLWVLTFELPNQGSYSILIIKIERNLIGHKFMVCYYYHQPLVLFSLMHCLEFCMTDKLTKVF